MQYGVLLLVNLDMHFPIEKMVTVLIVETNTMHFPIEKMVYIYRDSYRGRNQGFPPPPQKKKKFHKL